MKSLQKPMSLDDQIKYLFDEAVRLRNRVSELEAENTTMYAAIMEAAELGNNAAKRCKVELQRIARKDATK